MRARRAGYTLAELLAVMVLLAILVRIALPTYKRVTLKAHAAAALSDLQALRTAAFAYNAATGRWPRDTSPGEVPPELEPYLGSGFSFDRGMYQLDWDNWTLPDGRPKHPGTGVLLGVSVTTESRALGQALVQLAGPTTAHYTLGDNYTFIIDAL